MLRHKMPCLQQKVQDREQGMAWHGRAEQGLYGTQTVADLPAVLKLAITI